MRVLIAPDSFKGTLTSVEVARAFADGWLRARPLDDVRLAPLADGGEGTLAAVAASGGWSWRSTTVNGPLGAPVEAGWLLRADGGAAFLEMARASGLSLVPPALRDPVRASTRGTGELLRAALDAGVREIAIGIGGSATTDGGAGALAALGAAIGPDPGPGGEHPWSISLAGLDPRLAEVRLRIACDVTNPLLGLQGAAAVYGPQKGASPETVAWLDARNARFADALEAATGRSERATPGAGAAGGLGFGLLAVAGWFADLRLVPGIDLVMAETGFDAALAACDLVLTGEGRVDAQTAYGKTAQGVALRARAAGRRCIAVGGSVTQEGAAAMAAVGAGTCAVHEQPITLAGALAAGAGPLADRVAALALTIG